MDKDFDAAKHVAHMEELLGLPIKEEWRGEVENHIAATQKAASLVMAVKLDDEVEAAPVFVP